MGDNGGPPLEITVTLPTPHEDQRRAFASREDRRASDMTCSEAERDRWLKNGEAAGAGRRRVIRCGRRWGKTKYGSIIAGNGATKGEEHGWFAPNYKLLTEAYVELRNVLRPVTVNAQFGKVIRTLGGGRIDFWSLDDPSAGRSRRYHNVVIDEAAFTTSNMMDIWEQSIEPTLYDFGGSCLVCSNTNGVAPDNFLYQICNDAKFGFIEYHAPTINNPTLPFRRPGETDAEHMERRIAAIDDLRAKKPPLVFRQEYEAEFVDWSGVAFFALDKMLDKPRDLGGGGVPFPTKCDSVFATIDSATKTGTGHDGTGVIYWALSNYHPLGWRLVALDWEVVQIEGALLESWLPTVVSTLEHFAKVCSSRNGMLGAFIEDKSSGMVLLQQAERRGLPAFPIDSKLTSVGKDERAISVSGYHFQGQIKLSHQAYDKVSEFKGTSRNHLVSQVTGFRIGDKDAAKRADDLLDCYTYGAAMALGNIDGF